MKYMFYGAWMFNLPLDRWDVQKVTKMNAMFQYAHMFNQPLNNWDVSNVTDMNCARMFNLPLDRWDVQKVTKMNAMFSEALYVWCSVCQNNGSTRTIDAKRARNPKCVTDKSSYATR